MDMSDSSNGFWDKNIFSGWPTAKPPNGKNRSGLENSHGPEASQAKFKIPQCCELALRELCWQLAFGGRAGDENSNIVAAEEPDPSKSSSAV